MIRFILLIFAVSLPLSAGIIPIKPREVGEHPGLSGELAASLSTKRGNTETDNYAASAKVTYDSNATYLVWGMVRAEYGEAAGTKNTNNSFAHLRYIHQVVGNATVAEVFGQIEDDEFKSIKDRALAGAGLRWRFWNEHHAYGGLFFGLGAFYEYVGYSTQTDPLERNGRLNAYLAYTVHFHKDAMFGLIGYYQPRLNEFSDFMVNTSAKVEVPIYGRLYFAFLVLYTHDAVPATGRKMDDFSQLTQLKWKF